LRKNIVPLLHVSLGMKIKGCSKESIAQEKAIKELRTKLKYAKEISQEYLTSNLAVILAT